MGRGRGIRIEVVLGEKGGSKGVEDVGKKLWRRRDVARDVDKDGRKFGVCMRRKIGSGDEKSCAIFGILAYCGIES